MSTDKAVLVKNQHAEGTEQAREDWETVTKTPLRLPPFRFEFDGRRFVNFFIGASYPTHDSKGCVAVFGVRADDYVLELMEVRKGEDVFDILRSVVELRVKYGYGQIRGHIEYIIGEEERYQSVVAKTNEEMEKKFGDGRGVYFKDPADLERVDCLALYLHHLRQAMGSKLVDLAGNQVAEESLRMIGYEEAQKGKYKEYPIPAIVGGMVHTILFEDRQKEDYRAEGLSDCVFNLDEMET